MNNIRLLLFDLEIVYIFVRPGDRHLFDNLRQTLNKNLVKSQNVSEVSLFSTCTYRVHTCHRYKTWRVTNVLFHCILHCTYILIELTLDFLDFCNLFVAFTSFLKLFHTHLILKVFHIFVILNILRFFFVFSFTLLFTITP